MRITRSKAKWGALLAVVLAFGGCTDEFESINTNPNSPVAVPAATILTNATIATAKHLSGWLNHTYTALWSQMFAKVQYIDEDRYAFRPSNMNSFWSVSYLTMKDLDIVVKQAGEEGFTNIEAVARILLAYNFLTATDLWGDIPYSEALTADQEGGTATPVYDSQQAIYAGLLGDLAAANMLFDAAGDDLDALAGGDIVYSGDIAMWEKFANSLALRILMRMSAVDAATAKAGIEMIVAMGMPIFESNADDAQVVYLTGQSHWNPLFSANYTRTDFAMSSTMINVLQDAGRNDPRLPFYAQPRVADDTYVGQPNGAVNNPQISDVSLIGTDFGYTNTAPQVFMSYAEVEFILAEAALNGWAVGTAAEHYDAGIAASMDKVGVSGGDATTYMAESLVMYTGSPSAEQVGTQKWIALFPQGTEGFAEVRRTGYPSALVEPAGSAYPGDGLPRRFAYPEDEIAYNEANRAAAAAGITDDMYGKNVWWDLRTRGPSRM